MKVKAFYHCATINRWQEISDFFISKLLTKIQFIDHVFIGTVGTQNAAAKSRYGHPKITVVDFGPDLLQYEYPTQQLLHDECARDECKVLYMHTKGVTWTADYFAQVPNDFRGRFKTCDMSYPYFTTLGGNFEYPSLVRTLKFINNRLAWWLIDNIDKNLDALDRYDTCGLHLQQQYNGSFYPRNFWWARSSYILKLPRPQVSTDRSLAEFWLGNREDHRWYDFAKDKYCEPLPFGIKML